MELRLVKIVEGIPGKEGDVLFHEFGPYSYFLLLLFGPLISIFVIVKKAPAEAAALKAAAAAKETLKKDSRHDLSKAIDLDLVEEVKHQRTEPVGVGVGVAQVQHHGTQKVVLT